MQNNNCNGSRALFARGFIALCAALTMAAAAGSALAAPTETVLHAFAGSDGSDLVAGLIADSAGNLYGTTVVGGASNNGVVFKLSPGGTETVLYSFCSKPSCSDGANPVAGLIADSSGNLYGTTGYGGVARCGMFGRGCGVVFKLSPGGTETVLHSFAGGDGANPQADQAGLVADSAGNLYGTTANGGASNKGVVFKLSPGGTETVLHSFCSLPSCSDGEYPFAGLIADSSGNLYGTTNGGGASGWGVVFKLSPGGTYKVLHAFAGGDGANPAAGLIADSSGNLYGTTSVGGASNKGVVFRLSPGGTETVLHSFCSLPSCSDGAIPTAGLIAGRAGYLYGTTILGGASNNGVAFRLSPGGTETVLHTFCSKPSCSDGINPLAGLIAGSAGDLYGTTQGGGASNKGVMFKLAGTGFRRYTSAPSAPSSISPSAALPTKIPLTFIPTSP